MYNVMIFLFELIYFYLTNKKSYYIDYIENKLNYFFLAYATPSFLFFYIQGQTLINKKKNY